MKKFRFVESSDVIVSRSNSVNLLFNDVRTTRLSEDVVRSLIADAQKGDEDALNKVCKGNMLFVISMARRYMHVSDFTFEDLIAEGSIGLINAVRKFDLTKGNRFITFAMHEIRSAIINAIDENGRLVSCSHKLGRTFREGIDTPKGDAETSYLDVFESGLSADTFSEREHTAAKVGSLLSRLTDTESSVIKMAFGIGTYQHNTWEIAEKLGLSERRCEQIKESALQKMRLRRAV